jgi:hypothetical protein
VLDAVETNVHLNLLNLLPNPLNPSVSKEIDEKLQPSFSMARTVRMTLLQLKLVENK